MAKPFDAFGRALQIGDRRWAKTRTGFHELIYVDTVDEVVRFLALPLEHLEGETVAVASHDLKVVNAKFADAKCSYVCNHNDRHDKNKQ